MLLYYLATGTMIPMRYVLAAIFSCWLVAAQPVPWIIDTDGGTDDYLAIAYLLAKPNVEIEAIATVNGLSSPAAGARTVSRILQLAGRTAIPVRTGGRAALSKAEFPAEWRKMSEELPGVVLPAAPERAAQTAESYYLARLKRPARILALGPLTNLALVLQKNPALARNIRELVVMGGAVHVPGNLKDGDLLKTNNTTAEWNIYLDPAAAADVFRRVTTIKLVPLDATNRVPFRLEHVARFAQLTSPLGKLVAQILKLDEPIIREGYYYAWDPLAAVAAAEPAFGSFDAVAVEVSLAPGEEGRTKPVAQGGARVGVLRDPAPAAFHEEFYRAFTQVRKKR
jgi:inosine-uridine nucleoside N-ribohydrolase